MADTRSTIPRADRVSTSRTTGWVSVRTVPTRSGPRVEPCSTAAPSPSPTTLAARRPLPPEILAAAEPTPRIRSGRLIAAKPLRPAIKQIELHRWERRMSSPECGQVLLFNDGEHADRCYLTIAHCGAHECKAGVRSRSVWDECIPAMPEPVTPWLRERDG